MRKKILMSLAVCAEIGDTILTEEGYQRVIAINETGAFLTEPVEE